MPLEKASRSPRVCSWRGRYRSWARIEPSTGKPLNAVLAARNEDQRGHRGHHVEQDRAAAEDRLGELGGHGLLHVAGRPGDDLAAGPRRTAGRSAGPARRCRSASSTATTPSSSSVVAALRLFGLLERRHAVGDRLDAGERGAAGRERAQQQEDEGEAGEVACSAAMVRSALGARRSSPSTKMRTQPGEDHPDDDDHERVGRDGERGARLADAAQVDRGEQRRPRRPRRPPCARRRTAPTEPRFATPDETDTATVST